MYDVNKNIFLFLVHGIESLRTNALFNVIYIYLICFYSFKLRVMSAVTTVIPIRKKCSRKS